MEREPEGGMGLREVDRGVGRECGNVRERCCQTGNR